MAVLTWNDRFATGIPKVDDQHQSLFNTVNEFYEGLVEGRSNQELAVTLHFLVDYTVKHFKTEEDFMRRSAFPGLAAHRSEHDLLLDDVASFRDRWTRDPASVRPVEAAQFLGDWLTRHIQSMDFQYVQFLKDKGIAV